MAKSLQADFFTGVLNEFLNYGLPIDWPRAITATLASNYCRSSVVKVLLSQNKNAPAPVREAIDKLLQSNTLCVVAGQQPALFGGPLYNAYKAAAVILLSKKLGETYPNYEFVPVFWLASEDHDFEEVNHTQIRFEAPALTYNGKFKGAIGRHRIESDIMPLLGEVPALFAAAYQPGTTWANAFRTVLNGLFGEQGLIVVDGDSIALKSLFLPQIEQELTERQTGTLINQAGIRLKTAGYEHQLFGREVGLFYLTDQARNRITYKNNLFSTTVGDFTLDLDGILKLSTTHPERFSPSAGLRPIYQQTLLPTVAYLGGWGEIGYWLQLKAVFEHFGKPFPVVLPRLSARIVRATLINQLHELGFNENIVHTPDDKLGAQIAQTLYDSSQQAVVLQRIEDGLAVMDAFAQAVNPTLSKSVAATRASIEKQINQFFRSLEKNLLNQNPKVIQALLRLKNAIQPDGMEQERVLGIAAFVDNPAFGNWLLNALNDKIKLNPTHFETHCLVLPESYVS